MNLSGLNTELKMKKKTPTLLLSTKDILLNLFCETWKKMMKSQESTD